MELKVKQQTDKMTVTRLQAFSDAWDKGEINEVMSFFTDDCVFLPSVEDTPNATFRGRDAVATEFQQIFSRDCGYESRSGLHVVFGQGKYGYCEWSLVTSEDGQEAEVRGCDFFEFEGGLISRKDAFRKSPLWLDEE